MDNERLSALAAIKLRGLLSEHLPETTFEVVSAGVGAAAIIEDRAWLYQPGDDIDAVGPALVWAAARQVAAVNIVVDDSALAANAISGLDESVQVWQASERTLIPVSASDLDQVTPSPADHPLWSALVDAGLDIVPDHGIWLGELCGLEVARLTTDSTGPVIKLGVGAYDRGAFDALFPNSSPVDELPRVIDMVAGYRYAGAAPHLLNRLVHERWLRCVATQDPSIVGLVSLEAIPGPSLRAGLHTNVPDAALGDDADGNSVLVVFSAGLDTSVTAFAASLVGREQPDRVLFVSAHTDHHEAIEASLQWLSLPATWVTLPAPWL